MIFPFLMGLVGGQRAMTPLATISVAAALARVSDSRRELRILAHPVVAATSGLALAEMVGDKMKTAPDRIIPIGLGARFITSALAGAWLAPRRPWRGAAIGGSTAVLASYPGWRLRTAAIPRYGQTTTGVVEDALVVLSAVGILWASSRPASHRRVQRAS